jgi:hypothetical protein
MDSKLTTNFYKHYVGKYAKRFYAPFTKEAIHHIVGFELRDKTDPLINECLGKEAYFHMKDHIDGMEYEWDWDVEDCTIITDDIEELKLNTDRVACIKHEEYYGYNPFTGEIIEREFKFA